jgi:8-oxo-dGTP pyrophosphatase MutT (NUDIX family)
MTSWRERLQTREPEEVDADGLERTAVVVPVYVDEGRDAALFTRRADDLPRHAGQVSFPGGRQEDIDASLRETALREIHEEVGVVSADVEFLGQLDDVPTTTGYVIRPYVGAIPYPYDFDVQSDEVDSLILAPLDELTHPSVHEERTRGDFTIHYFHYDEYTIWGATAAILVELLDVAVDWQP